ncbi:Major facilitator superfamily MFS_1 [Candidatus Sulfotelmatomonas gaucii]|uniref:Major facilitator superfamily MFS_1 n=1 Tax=Candidatus Sulfuritelmatomonas gaucii TaxID=2043161 RepID=A0A2N9M5K9_9BACT|nr:Major facilitator superfamily MFS_1 [Candidatus Sulfotelmatomonas gaucii]
MPDASSIPVKMTRREWIVVALLVASVVINYVDRSNLSLAVPTLEKQFGISSLQAGELLSAFFWTYALVQVFGLAGWLADRFHAGWVLFGGYLLWSLATAFTGLTAGFVTFFALRLALGVGESVAYPCYSRIFAAMPQEHRGRANALIDAGTKLGPAAGAFVGGLVLVHFGWRMLFVFFGLGALIWLPFWYKVMPPGEGNGDKRQEVEKPADEQRSEPGNAESPSIAKMLRLQCAWGSFLGHFCGNYFYYFLLTWLPTYLVQEEHLSIGAMSRLTSAVFFLIACSTLVAGFLSDRLIAGGASPTIVRRSVTSGGLVLASCLIPFSLVHGNPALALGLLAIACTGQGAYASNHWAITQTLAGPVMAGRWSSLQNGIANFSGIVAPWLTGLIVQTQGSARLAFTVTGVVALIGGLSWGLLVRRVEPVRWEEIGPKPLVA